MKEKIITNQLISAFETFLLESEKSEATIKKYLHDIHYFAEYASGCGLDKTLLLKYKGSLVETYTIRSANSMIAALNSFLRFLGWNNLCIKQFKVQQEAYCSEDKELTKSEYAALVRTAEQKKTNDYPLLFKQFAEQAFVSVN